MLEEIVIGVAFNTRGQGSCSIGVLSFLLFFSTILVNKFRFKESLDLDTNL